MSPRKALGRAFAEAWGVDDDDVLVTRIQERALESISDAYLRERGKGFVITGNTGSGKTEAALLPILLGAVEERLRGVEGCKLLLVYPRQELAKNQLQRLCRYLSLLNRSLQSFRGGSVGALSCGIVFGDTPWHDVELRDGGRYLDGWEARGGGYELPYFVDELERPVVLTDLAEGVGAVEAGGVGFGEGDGGSRDSVRPAMQCCATRPTSSSSRPRCSTDGSRTPRANDLFGLPTAGSAPRFAPPRAVLFDEIHLYDTLHGAQVGLHPSAETPTHGRTRRRQVGRLEISDRDWHERDDRSPRLVLLRVCADSPTISSRSCHRATTTLKRRKAVSTSSSSGPRPTRGGGRSATRRSRSSRSWQSRTT